MNLFKNKRCPRCNLKMPKECVVCSNCKLNFQKYDSATNYEAKQAMRQGETERVLMRTGTPIDINKIKLWLLTFFLGFMGAHYLYVGRKKMGIFCLSFFIVGLLNAGVQIAFQVRNDLTEILSFLSLIWGAVLLIWIIDIFKVAFNRFKIPVSREK